MSFFFPSKVMRAPFAIGKMPASPEFLRPLGTREPTRSFDAWLEASMEYAAHRHGSAWLPAFESGAPLGFTWRAPSSAKADAALVGLLVPSRDAVGRHYPLAVVAEIATRSLARNPHVAPLACGAFFERAYDVLQAQPDPARLGAQLAALSAPDDDDVERALAEYDAWTRATRSEDAWSALFAGAVSRGPAAVHMLRALIRSADGPGARPMLRLPLGCGGNAGATLWLDLVRRLPGFASAFWDIERGTLVAVLGEPTPALLPALWMQDALDPSVLEAPCAPASAQPPASRRGVATLYELLAEVGS